MMNNSTPPPNPNPNPNLLVRIKNFVIPPRANLAIPPSMPQLARDPLSLAYDATIEVWSRMLEIRKEGSEGHIRRVTDMTVELARKMGMTEEEIVNVRRGALLHDIGEMGVPDSILLKDGPLVSSERVIMRRHPQYAYDMLSSIIYLRPALDIPHCHHEKWDGTGYPRGLKGEEIPLAARIFAVVDVWEALRTPRTYRKALSEEEARQYLTEQSGQEFDPSVVKAFIELMADQKKG